MAIALLVIVYFIPAIIAIARSHVNTVAICALNLILGWTLLGWIGAMIWSLTSPKGTTIVINNSTTSN